MKRFLTFLLVLIISATAVPVNINADEPDIQAPSAILMEASTGEIIYEKNADEILRPASITKIMTLLLIFDALDEGKISLEDPVTVSEHAASMGGSQVFLEPGEIQTVETLIKCIAIASANDACVAMAEHIWSSEAVFVDKMNERAKGLNMTNTNFVNSCGLDADGHVTTARDVAVMSRELITRHPEVHNYSTIWMDSFTHVTRKGESEFTLSNTNKLLKQYEWATGLKTGSTSLAKFCLSATAKKNDIELISVVMASPNGKTRVSDSISLLNYGYGICHLYKDDNMPILTPLSVKNSTRGIVSCEYSSDYSHLFLQSFDEALITKELEYAKSLSAPIAKGDTVGQLIYKYDGEIIGTVDILAAEDVKKS
ncbi:MAG: D-alanyl-D-alanine carboxypeptidase family protein, partial [Butyrivibrio sp.]